MTSFDTRKRRPFRSLGVGREWPPLNPVPEDITTTVAVSWSQIINTEEVDTSPRWLVYNTATTLDTTAGNRFYVPRRIIIQDVMVSVEGAPSSTLTGDLLRNGTTLFPSATKPTVASGSLYGALREPDIGSVDRGDYLTCQLTATGSATGPAKFYIQYRRT